MAQSLSTAKEREQKLVFQKANIDPLSTPDAFEPAQSKKETDSKLDDDDDEEDKDEEKNYDAIEANIERAKQLKKKKVDFRAEMTSDSTEIDDLLRGNQRKKDTNEKEEITKIDEELLDVGDDDLLKVEKEKNDKKSLEDLLAETDDMFKEIDQDKQEDIATKDLNVDDDFNFDQYINQQDARDGDDELAALLK